MGNLLHLRDAHEQARMLLPWHVNGTLETAEAAWLEAHLAQCAECRADLASDTKLRSHIASLPLAIEPAGPPSPERRAARPKTAVGPWRFLHRRITLGWALAGQAAAAAAAVAVLLAFSPAQQDRGYRLLSSEELGPTNGNAIVLFSRDATEQQLRDAFTRNGTRIVDGPTASGAYVVRAPARDETLQRLREMPQVILAEPLDGGDAS